MPLLTCRVVISEVGESLFPWIIGDNLIHQYPLEDWIEQTPPHQTFILIVTTLFLQLTTVCAQNLSLKCSLCLQPLVQMGC